VAPNGTTIAELSDGRSLADRKRDLVRRELATAAAKLLETSDYESITVEGITDAAGVSRRTFFRYFSSKDAVFLATLEEFGRSVQWRLATAPRSERPSSALRSALTAGLEEQVQKSYELTRTTHRVPSLERRRLEYLASWRRPLAQELATKAGHELGQDVRPLLAVAIALTAFDTALEQWVDQQGRSPVHDLLDEAFELVSAAIDDMLAWEHQ
jgi:AcrR family transcriptional regulator